MTEIVTFPPLRNLKSMITLPVRWLSVDLEYCRDELDKKFCVVEIAFFDIYAKREIFRTFVKPKDNFLLSRRMQEKGISLNEINSAPTMEELDQLFRTFLPSCILVFWNAQNDLRHYPKLKSYAYGIRCAMKRYSERHGPYNIDWGDHQFLKLEEVAIDEGFVLDENEKFHQALTDAKATAYIWDLLDKETLPSPIPLDLVLREDVETLLLESKSQVTNFEDLEEEDPIPF